MICKETEKMIPLFLEDDLDTDDLKAFLEHIERCEECREELTIQFLVTEGMARLETGSVFDLKNELKTLMDNAEYNLRRRENLRWVLYALEGFAALEIAVIVVFILFF